MQAPILSALQLPLVGGQLPNCFFVKLVIFSLMLVFLSVCFFQLSFCFFLSPFGRSFFFLVPFFSFCVCCCGCSYFSFCCSLRSVCYFSTACINIRRYYITVVNPRRVSYVSYNRLILSRQRICFSPFGRFPFDFSVLLVAFVLASSFRSTFSLPTASRSCCPRFARPTFLAAFGLSVV